MKFSINAKPYAFKVHVIVTEDMELAAEFVVKHSDRTLDDLNELKDQFSVVFVEEGMNPIMCLKRVPVTPAQYAEFFHEVFHACAHIGQCVGLSLEEFLGESFAYFLEDISKKILVKIEKLKISENNAKGVEFSTN